MATLVLKLTDAGLAAVQAASGTDPTVIGSLGLTAEPFDYAPTLTALPGEFKRVDVASGIASAANVTHLTAYDTSADVWTATGFGLFLDDGTLFAVHTGSEPVMTKVGLAFALLAFDIAFEADFASNIAYGNAVFAYPAATEDVAGVAEIATQAEINAGDDDRRFVTPRKLRDRLASIVQAIANLVTAINDETAARSNADAALGGSIDAEAAARSSADNGLQEQINARLVATAYTANDVRTKLLTVDGADSGIDADLLDGHHGSDYDRIVEQSLGANGYIVYASGKKECWGTVSVPTNSAVIVTLPTAHTAWFNVALGPGLRVTTNAQNNTAIQAKTGFESFTLRNWEDVAISVDWSTRGV